MKTAVVNARIDPKIKKSAEKVLDKLGISMSQAVSMFLARVGTDRGIPFDLKVPNAETVRAMAEIKAGKGHSYKNFKDLRDEMGV
jgi:DNA-damage-inducible protein J